LFQIKNNWVIESEYVNPGGRELFLRKKSDGKSIRIQLQDQCYNCDVNKINKELL
jgi:hypothetical protein